LPRPFWRVLKKSDGDGCVEKLNDYPVSSHPTVTNPFDDAPKSGAIN
jgi:hypothetical protein